MGRREQQVRTLAVFDTEQKVCVFRPATGGLVGFARKKRRKVHFLGTSGLHLLAHDRFDLAAHLKPQRQPGEDSGRLPTDVPGPHQKAVADGLGIGRILAKGTDKEVGESCWHENYSSFGAPADPPVSLAHCRVATRGSLEGGSMCGAAGLPRPPRSVAAYPKGSDGRDASQGSS